MTNHENVTIRQIGAPDGQGGLDVWGAGLIQKLDQGVVGVC